VGVVNGDHAHCRTHDTPTYDTQSVQVVL